MITDEKAKKLVEGIMSSTRVLNKYCKDHDCADCQFHREYDEFTEEYVCDIWDTINVSWHE